MKNLIDRLLLVSAVAGTCVLLGLTLRAQPPLPGAGQGDTNSVDVTNQLLMRQRMRAMQEQMAAEIQTQDTELEQLVNQLNTLQGDQKIEALTAAVTNLAGQRLMLHHQWETMHDMMSGTNMAGTNNPANTNGWQHQQTPQAPR